MLRTGYAEASLDGEASRDAGFEVIDKPYGRLELARRIRSILDGPSKHE